jgi:flavin reductase (DIM6/NTAB) family NADH-FMN oxidoreductase RutF
MPDRAFHSYRPAQGHGLAHDPLNSIVAPRPIGWISTVSRDGVPNLAPYSFFNLFSYRPPIIGFSSGGEKDSLVNARATGEFVWNLVSRDLAEAMNETSAEVRPDVDEFARAGLAALPSSDVAAPRVGPSAVQFECKVTQILRLTDSHGADSANWVVFGEVVHVHIDPAHIVDGIYRTASPRPVARGGGPADYFEITEEARFQIARPKA